MQMLHNYGQVIVQINKSWGCSASLLRKHIDLGFLTLVDIQNHLPNLVPWAYCKPLHHPELVWMMVQT